MFRLGSVGRPKAGAGHIGQDCVVSGRHLRERVNRLRTVRSAENAVSVVIKERTFLEVVRPIDHCHCVAGLTAAFDGVLIDRGIDHAQIVEDATGLGTLAGAKETWNGNSREQSNNGDDDHDFDESEPFARLCRGRIHIYKES